MGSEFVSPNEAATLLGVTRRTISTHLQKGTLRRVKLGKGNRTGIPREDVEALAIDLGNNFPPLNKKTLFRLLAQVERLERDVLVLKRMNAVTDIPLRPAKLEALGLFQAAGAALKVGAWSVDEMTLWADLFDRMDEVFFDALEAQEIVEPWKPFYDLCVAQMKFVAAMETFDRNVDLQHLHKRLAEGMKLLRRVILVWVEMGNGRHTDSTLSKMDQSESLLRRLIANGDCRTG